jgi:catechol-2,3-dioxygenase
MYVRGKNHILLRGNVFMNHPISHRVSSVFVHVKDLKESTEFYNDILGLPIKPENGGGGIHELKMSSGADIILDQNRH